MQPNVGVIDRLFRLILGIGLMGSALATSSVFSSSLFQYGAIAVGAVLVATATLRICPLYTLLGIRTCDCESSD